MRDFLPKGVLGMLLASLFAAYMSTMSTQLNWGTSYLVNDFYLRFVSPYAKRKTSLQISRLLTILLAIAGLFVTYLMDSISEVWEFIMECGAGLGLVLILRWYWWRINAWAEITATLAPFIAYAIAHYGLCWVFPNSFFFTVAFTTLAWIITMYITSPESHATLVEFYQTIRPGGAWKPVAWKVEKNEAIKPPSSIRLLVYWLLGIAVVYGALFGVGALLFG
jgi:Na+/proline symporter